MLGQHREILVLRGLHLGLHGLHLRGEFGVSLGDLLEVLVALRDVLLRGEERLLGVGPLVLGQFDLLGGGLDLGAQGLDGLGGLGEKIGRSHV